jgi:hypothetical protein
VWYGAIAVVACIDDAHLVDVVVTFHFVAFRQFVDGPELEVIVEHVIKERRKWICDHAYASNIRTEKEARTSPKTLVEKCFIVRALNVNTVFLNLKNIECNAFVDHLYYPILVPAGIDIAVIGELADYLCKVKEGTFSRDKGTKKVQTLKRGSSFGETGGSLLSRAVFPISRLPHACLTYRLCLQAKFYAACEILALEHLAQRSMACRDLKPENIILDADGYGIMIDMGFAKVIEGCNCYTFCGTPESMSRQWLHPWGGLLCFRCSHL